MPEGEEEVQNQEQNEEQKDNEVKEGSDKNAK